MAPRYRVTLTEQERNDLEALTRNGKTGAKKFIHARALLLCDAGPDGPVWPVVDVAEALGITSRRLSTSKNDLSKRASKLPWNVIPGKSRHATLFLTVPLKHD